MKDAINNAHGFGCHCRNCQFACKSVTKNENFDNLQCQKGILQRINYNSFCSEGEPEEGQKRYNVTNTITHTIVRNY